MKKILALLIVLLMCLSVFFVSCGEKNENDDEDEADLDEKDETDDSDKDKTDDSDKDETDKGDSDKDDDMKYDYDMSKYISIPDYKAHTFEIEEDTIKLAISTYLMQYATDYSVRRGDKIQVTMKFYELVDPEIEVKGDEITELAQNGVLIEHVAKPNSNGDYQISYQLESALLNAKMGTTVSKLLTLDNGFFNENYRHQKVFVDMKIDNKVCQEDDVLTVSYTGYHIDANGNIIKENGKDKTFDTSDNSPFFIGSHLAIDDFENGLVGMMLGEEKDIYATFPSDYEAEPSLAGKQVLFKVKVKSCYTPPVCNDEFVKSYFDYETVAEFEEALLKEYILSKAYEYINENAQVLKYPSKEYEMTNEQLDGAAGAFESQYGMTLDEYIWSQYSMTRDEYVKSNMKTEMVLYALRNMIGDEAIPTEAELAKERQKLVDKYKQQYMGGERLNERDAIKKANQYVDSLGSDYIYENVMYAKIDEIIPNQVKINLIPSEREYCWENK